MLRNGLKKVFKYTNLSSCKSVRNLRGGGGKGGNPVEPEGETTSISC